MQLPDGSILMHGKRPYDPVKAREYYLRTRKLKGRKTGGSQPPDQARYKSSLNKFLKSLPMSKEGATPEETEKFVDSLRGKTDAELREAAKNMKNTPGRQDADIKAQTVMALLENRNRIRSKTADAKKVAQKNVDLKKRKLTKAG